MAWKKTAGSVDYGDDNDETSSIRTYWSPISVKSSSPSVDRGRRGVFMIMQEAFINPSLDMLEMGIRDHQFLTSKTQHHAPASHPFVTSSVDK